MNPDYSFLSDNWMAIYSQYGAGAANDAAAAAATGDIGVLNATLSDIRRNTTNANYAGSTSTLGNLVQQLTTNPLGAPLDSANGILKNTFSSLLKNPAVLVTGAVILFLALGGFAWAQRQLAKR